MFNNYSIIWIIRIFLQIRIRIRIFLPESQIFGFGFKNFLTTNKIRIRIRKFSGLRIRFEIRIRSKKRFVSTLYCIVQRTIERCSSELRSEPRRSGARLGTMGRRSCKHQTTTVLPGGSYFQNFYPEPESGTSWFRHEWYSIQFWISISMNVSI